MMESSGSLVPSPTSTINSYDSSVSSSSVCSSTIPRQPPAYGEEPPQYQEELLSQAKARERKTIFIRLLTSIFITVLVSLIVAAVVERIHDNRGDVHHEVPTRSVEKITVISTQASSASPDAAAAEATSDPATATSDPASETPETASATPAVSTPLGEPVTIDCASMTLLSGASLVTSFQQPSRRAAAPTPTPAADEPGRRVQDVAVYSFRGCLWAQASYRLGGGRENLSRRCTVTCPADKPDGIAARGTRPDDSDWDRG